MPDYVYDQDSMDASTADEPPTVIHRQPPARLHLHTKIVTWDPSGPK